MWFRYFLRFQSTFEQIVIRRPTLPRSWANCLTYRRFITPLQCRRPLEQIVIVGKGRCSRVCTHHDTHQLLLQPVTPSNASDMKLSLGTKSSKPLSEFYSLPDKRLVPTHQTNHNNLKRVNLLEKDLFLSESCLTQHNTYLITCDSWLLFLS